MRKRNWIDPRDKVNFILVVECLFLNKLAASFITLPVRVDCSSERRTYPVNQGVNRRRTSVTVLIKHICNDWDLNTRQRHRIVTESVDLTIMPLLRQVLINNPTESYYI